MKIILLLLLLLCAAPAVGFLQIYNFLDAGDALRPRISQQPLTGGALQPGRASSVIMLPSGNHRLTLETDSYAPQHYHLSLAKGESLTLCVIYRYEAGFTSPQLLLLSNVAPAQQHVVPLKIHSACTHPLTVQLHGTSLSIPPRSTVAYPSWNGGSFSVVIQGHAQSPLQPEETVGHTLLIWKHALKGYRTELIPIYQYTPPQQLNADGTFGRPRAAIKGLIPLTPSSE